MFFMVSLSLMSACVPQGVQRDVKCDVWRAFTNAKPHAMPNQAVQHDIAKEYKTGNGKLKTMELESDGSTCQFKGRFNFWVVAGGMFKKSDYAGLRLKIRFTAPGHGGGCADVQGKTAAHFLKQRPQFRGKAAYNYHTAYELCKEGMQEPSKSAEKVKGVWGCNGKFFWRVLSNGKDKLGRKKKFPVVPQFEGGDITGIAGSRHLYAFRQVGCSTCIDCYWYLCHMCDNPFDHWYLYEQMADNDRDATTGGREVTCEARFIDCCCTFCRADDEKNCPYTEQFGTWQKKNNEEGRWRRCESRRRQAEYTRGKRQQCAVQGV